MEVCLQRAAGAYASAQWTRRRCLAGTRRDAVELFHRETVAYSIYLVSAYVVLCYGIKGNRSRLSQSTFEIKSSNRLVRERDPRSGENDG